MGSRVRCNVYWSSMAAATRTAESGETCCTCGRGRTRCCPCDRDAGVPKTDWRRHVTKRDLVKYGYTDECLACTQSASGIHNAKVPNDNRCRHRIGELMVEDDDQRQVERVTSRSVSEVEIPCPEAKEEMDVGEPSVQPQPVRVEDQPQPASQPVPKVRVGGSSSSGTRARSVSRAGETSTDDDREVKRVRFAESRGQKRQGEDMEELVSKAEEQHLDADVEVPVHKTWRVEDVVGDAADAAPEQMDTLLDAREQSMNRFVQSKTEVFEKIAESLRPLCMVEDLNDDEIMEFCILSNEVNACESAAVLNPLKFASCATRLGLREGFPVDLATARANGTMWDLSLEDDKAELRRVQKREQPELLAGSPPSDDFYSLLNTCADPQETRAGKRLRFNPLSATRECTALMVRCVAGV